MCTPRAIQGVLIDPIGGRPADTVIRKWFGRVGIEPQVGRSSGTGGCSVGLRRLRRCVSALHLGDSLLRRSSHLRRS